MTSGILEGKQALSISHKAYTVAYFDGVFFRAWCLGWRMRNAHTGSKGPWRVDPDTGGTWLAFRRCSAVGWRLSRAPARPCGEVREPQAHHAHDNVKSNILLPVELLGTRLVLRLCVTSGEISPPPLPSCSQSNVSRRISWWQVPERLLGKGIGVYGPELRYFGSAYSQDLGNLTTS